jgi:hypothetical protein
LAYASSAFAGMNPEARGVSLALVNALGNLAQIYGSVRVKALRLEGRTLTV